MKKVVLYKGQGIDYVIKIGKSFLLFFYKVLSFFAKNDIIFSYFLLYSAGEKRVIASIKGL